MPSGILPLPPPQAHVAYVSVPFPPPFSWAHFSSFNETTLRSFPHTNSDSVAAAQALGKDGIVGGKIKTTKGNTMLNLDNGGGGKCE